MPPRTGIAALHEEMRGWRHDLHARPELAFEEHETAAYVAEKLTGWGLDVATGIGGTGVVGTLRAGTSERRIGLRAELDALPIEEATGVPHASRSPGRMHACGHDGHTAMLLGAARYLADSGDFDGTVRFIFQPAEENEAGGRAMLEDGLLERFDVDEVYGLHNSPGLPVGRFALRPGAITAALDLFEITVHGRGGHAAMPHAGTDTIVCAAALVTGIQTIVSRTVDPFDAAVVSVTQIAGGNSWNILPETVTLRGTARSFRHDVQDTVERRLDELVEHVAAAHGCTGALEYERRYPATVNTPAQTRAAAEAATALAGADAVDVDIAPTTAAEDFAFLLGERPGCYVFLGNGSSAPVHTPEYDFEDDALPWGASYWVTLVERRLGRGRVA